MDLFESTFNAVFFLSGATIFCGGLGVLFQFCFKSKCRECIICGGLIHIIRDVQAENEEMKMEIDHIPRPQDNMV